MFVALDHVVTADVVVEQHAVVIGVAGGVDVGGADGVADGVDACCYW